MSNLKRAMSNYAWMGLIGVAVGLMAAGCIPVTDGTGEGQIAVTAAASPATVNPSGQSVVTATVTGATGTVTYAWSIAGQAGIVGATTGSSITVLANSVGTAIATVTAVDSGTGTNATATATITIEAATPPASDLAVTATATPASLALPDTSTLFAAPTGGTAPYTFSWLQTSGAGAVIVGDANQTAVVTLPAVGTYTFTVTVTDAAGASITSDPVTVTAASTSLAFTDSALDNLVGSSGADTFTAEDGTIVTTDKADGSTGADALDIIFSGAAAIANPAPTLTAIETFNFTDINAAGASQFNATNTTGLQTINVIGSSQALTVNNVPALVTVGLTDTAANLTLGWDATEDPAGGDADAVTVNLSNVTGSTITIPSIETLNVVSSGAANTATLTAAAATTLNITGDQDLTLGAIPATVETVGGSAATGALTFATAANDVAVTTGSGDDVVTWTAGQFDENDSVALGTGTDTLVLTIADASALTTDEAALITGAEKLAVSNAINAAVDGTLISGVTTIVAQAGINAATITLASAQAVEIAANNGGAATFEVDGTGTTDTTTVTLQNVDTSAGAMTFTGIETLNLVSDTGANVTGAVTLAPSAGVGTGTVVITGAENLVMGVVTASPVTATAFTGDLTVTASATATTIVGGTGDDTITGGAGNDSLTGGEGDDTLGGAAGGDSINGGAGDDGITGGAGNDTLAGGAGADTFVFAATAVLNGGDTISDFTTDDVLNVSAFATDDAPAGTVADTATGNQAVATNDIWIVTDADGSINTAAEVEALFGGGGKPFAAGIANMNVVVIVVDTQSGGDTTVWYVDDANADTTVDAGEAALVATLSDFNTILEDAQIAN